MKDIVRKECIRILPELYVGKIVFRVNSSGVSVTVGILEWVDNDLQAIDQEEEAFHLCRQILHETKCGWLWYDEHKGVEHT